MGIKRKICWGKDYKVEILSPSIDQFTIILKDERIQCGLYNDTLECWGRIYGGGTLIPPLKNPKQVVVVERTSSFCALDDDGVKCWGGAPVPSLRNVIHLSSFWDGFCAKDQSPSGVIRKVCWGGGAILLKFYLQA